MSFLYLFRWDFARGEYVPVVFEEVMINHLEIESSLVLAESLAGKEQIAKYGIPAPEDGESDNADHVSTYLFRKL